MHTIKEEMTEDEWMQRKTASENSMLQQQQQRNTIMLYAS